MQLILGRGTGARACSSFWEEGRGGKSMKLVLGRVGSHPFSLLIFIAPKICWGVWDQGCPYPPFRLYWAGFYSHSPLGQAGPILIFVRSYTVAVNSEIDNKNYVAADSEIGSQKLFRCRFRNWQRWWSYFCFSSLFFFFQVFTTRVQCHQRKFKDSKSSWILVRELQ